MPVRTDTSTLILDAAQDLVQTRGFNAFSYADISEVVGIRKASIHYHFPTKAQLGKSLVERYNAEFSRALAQIRESNASAVDRLVALVALYANTLGESKLCLCSMLGAGIFATPSDLHDGVKSFFADTTAWIAEVIREDVSLASDDPDAAARALLAELTGLQLVARATDLDTEEFQKAAISQYIEPLQA